MFLTDSKSSTDFFYKRMPSTNFLPGGSNIHYIPPTSSEDDKRSGAERDLTLKAEQLLPTDQQASFDACLKKYAGEIRSIARERRRAGFSEEAIMRETTGLYATMQEKGEAFLQKTVENHYNCANAFCISQDFDARLADFRIDFRPFEAAPMAKASNVMQMMRTAGKVQGQGNTAVKEVSRAPKDDSTLYFPSKDKLASCLEKHPQSNDPYLKQQGVIDAVVKTFADEERYPVGVLVGVSAILEDNLKVPNSSKNAIQINLTQAVEDCAL